MDELTRIPMRNELAKEDTWATEDMYATDEAWEAELATLAADQEKAASYAGKLGTSGKALCEYLTSLTLPKPWRTGVIPTAGALAALIAEASERGLGTPVSLTVLRSMAKARYSSTAIPHFGLSLPLYCHFTSPIRRLSDLVTHRIIEAVLLDGAAPQKYRDAARRGADAATDGELRALTAERRIEALYKTLYMKKHLGKTFEGMVSSVTPHGFYVELPNTCEGLVPLSLLDGTYTFDERRRTLTRGNHVISVGDPATIVVKDADVTTGKITFALAG